MPPPGPALWSIFGTAFLLESGSIQLSHPQSLESEPRFDFDFSPYQTFRVQSLFREDPQPENPALFSEIMKYDLQDWCMRCKFIIFTLEL